MVDTCFVKTLFNLLPLQLGNLVLQFLVFFFQTCNLAYVLIGHRMFPIAIDAFVVVATVVSPAWTTRCLSFAFLFALLFGFSGHFFDFFGSVASADPLLLQRLSFLHFDLSGRRYRIVVLLDFFAFLYAFFILL